MSGKGTYTWKLGKTYEGNWLNNLPNGDGTLTYSNGARYEGEMLSSQR